MEFSIDILSFGSIINNNGNNIINYWQPLFPDFIGNAYLVIAKSKSYTIKVILVNSHIEIAISMKAITCDNDSLILLSFAYYNKIYLIVFNTEYVFFLFVGFKVRAEKSIATKRKTN